MSSVVSRVEGPGVWRAVRVSVLVKLATLAVRADEYFTLGGMELDAAAIRALLRDPEVQELIAGLQETKLVPVKGARPDLPAV